MQLQIKCDDEKIKSFIERKVEKYIALLKIKAKLKNHTLDIRVLKKSPGMDKDDYGIFWPSFITRDYKDPGNYHKIIINRRNIENRTDLKRTLFHELVHVKQCVTKKMIWLLRASNQYTQAVWKSKKLGRIIDIDYYSRPWEIEAHNLEEKYYREKKL